MFDEENRPLIPMEDLFPGQAPGGDETEDAQRKRDSPLAVDRPYRPQQSGEGAFTLLV